MSRSVGEFTLVGHLGEGSFATVFLARQRDTGREFAMKAISRARMHGKLQENLESEISILKSFRHGNIVELYDIKKTERHIYLVLEYCAGGDLRALIRKEGRLAEPAVRHFTRHLGSGLHFLWSKNLVHRDLKPQNLLLTGPGLDATLKIADFGFARHLAQASMAETICGSPLYMAPEILEGQKYGAKADLWSVGVIVFEMLAGKPPFGGANQFQLLANIRRAPTPPPSEGYYPMPEGVPRVGRSCAELLCGLLVPDPQYRASFRVFFNSDFLRSTSSPGDDSTASAGGGAGDQPGRSETRRQDALGASNPTTPAAPGTTTAGDGERRGSADTDRERYTDPVLQSPRSGYSGHGRVPGAGGTELRGTFAHPRAGLRVEARGAQQGSRPMQRQRQGQGQGQGHDRGSWWPLAGWRWGGGGAPGGGGGDGVDLRGRSVDDEAEIGRPARTYSEPTTETQQRNRIKTSPSSFPHRTGGVDYFRQKADAGGGGATFSKGGHAGAGGGWTQQQGTPSRPPLTPPSPAMGSSSPRGAGGGANPIPIRQSSSRRGTRGGGGGYHGYDERDARRGQAPWSPSDAGEVRGGGGSRQSSSRSPRYGGGHRNVDDGAGAKDAAGGIFSPQSYEQQRLRSCGPSSAPEVSYMGYAAARAHGHEREREDRRGGDGAATAGGVVYSSVGHGGDRALHDRHASYDLGAAVYRRPPGQGTGTPWMSDARGFRAPDESPRQHRPRSSLHLGVGSGPTSSVEGSPRYSPRDSTTTRRYSASKQLTVTTPTMPSAAAAAAGSIQVLSSSPPESYPLQLVAMIGAQRQRMWGISGGASVGLTGLNAVVPPIGGAFVYAAGGAETAAAVGGGLDSTPRARFEQEAAAVALEQQYRQHQMKGYPDSNDGSGGSDDFVMVDGGAMSSDHLGGQQQHLQRLGGPTGGRGGREAEVTDSRALGPRLVAAGGRWVWGGAGLGRPTGATGGVQSGFSVARGGRGEATGAGDDRGAAMGAGGPPPLSWEGAVRCLQLVELFGRRAVLLAELGDSRVVPAMHTRQKERLDAQMRSSRIANDGAGGGGGAQGSPGTDSLRGLQFAMETGPFEQTGERPGGAFNQGATKPPLSADQDGTAWFSSLMPAPATERAFGASSSHDSGSSTAAVATATASGSVCCDSHRLFGEALVLYLKSLSMAKEAIVWGNQALEFLAVTNSSTNRTPHQPPPPSPPPSSPNLHAPSHSVAGLLPSRGGPDPVTGPGDAARSPDDVNRDAQGQQPSSFRINDEGGVDITSPRANANLRPGSGRVGRIQGGDGTVASPDRGQGCCASGGAATSGPTASSPLSSEAQVAAWGASLLGWLTGQFSTVLRRAERCRLELRGSSQEEESRSTTAEAVGTCGAAGPGENRARVTRDDGRVVGGGVRTSSETSPRGGDTRDISSSPRTRGQTKVGEGTPPPSAPLAAEASTLSSPSRHGAGPGAVAVSAKDIVVRAALAQAQESAASEVLGMWEPARRGYEKAALLLETLLLDSLVARPDFSASLSRSSVAGRAGTVASPRRGYTSSGRESTIVAGGGGGVLSEADQRILQSYMMKFARRAAEVADMEKEEARAAATATICAPAAVDARSTEEHVAGS